MPPVDITNQKFGRLTALYDAGSHHAGVRLWKCKCECGNTTTVSGISLRAGHVKSCGCLRQTRFNEVHQRQCERHKSNPNRCIIRRNTKYRVVLNRDGEAIYGGTFNSLNEAISRRTVLELVHPYLKGPTGI